MVRHLADLELAGATGVQSSRSRDPAHTLARQGAIVLDEKVSRIRGRNKQCCSGQNTLTPGRPGGLEACREAALYASVREE